MKVLVTGGAGYVGSNLIPKLLKKGYFVTVLDWYMFGDHVLSKYKKNQKLKQIKDDIRNIGVVEKVLKNCDAIIHLACISNDPSFELDPKLGKSVNYDATLSLIDLAKKVGIRKFIYASSSSVYGVKKENVVTENLILEPLTDYSKYKALCEEYLLQKKSDDFVVTILRPATVCGYSLRLRLDLTVNMLTLQALVNHEITVFGGVQKRPNIHIEDMTDLYTKLLAYSDKRINGKIYNVGYENYSILHIAKMIKKALGDSKVKITVQPTNDPRSYKISSRKIQKELGFKPQYSIEKAVLDLRDAYVNGKIPNAFTNPYYFNIKTHMLSQ